MLCLHDSIRDDDPAVQRLLCAVEDAHSLKPCHGIVYISVHICRPCLIDASPFISIRGLPHIGNLTLPLLRMIAGRSAG